MKLAVCRRETRETVSAALKDLILTLDDDRAVTSFSTSVRTVRKLAFDVLRRIRPKATLIGPSHPPILKALISTAWIFRQ